MIRNCRWKKFRLGGHSKGGNLAVWAAMHLPEKLQRRRLIEIYNNDGPGFAKSVLASDGFHRISGRIHTFIPESSIVGMLLENTGNYEVIGSSNHLLMQHESLSWNVVGNTFCRREKRSGTAEASNEAIRDWLAEMSPQERKEFVETFYEVISMHGKTKTLDDLREGGFSGGMALLREYIGTDEKRRKAMTQILLRLASEMTGELRRTAGQYLRSLGENIGRKRREKNEE